MSDLTIFSDIPDDAIGTIATPLREGISAGTHISYTRTDWSWASGKQVGRIFVQGSQLPLQRNQAIHAMRGDWIIFIDDDMVFDPTAIGELVASYYRLKDAYAEPLIVGALCSRRYPPFQPTTFQAVDLVEGPFRALEDWEGQDYVECDATGAAFYLIETDVFAAIMGGPFPDPETRYAIRHPWPYYEWVGSMGEDFRFCLKAKAAGCRVFVDTRIRIGHIAQVVVDIRDFWREMAVRSPEKLAIERTANDSMGLPTMTPRRAKELLRG